MARSRSLPVCDSVPCVIDARRADGLDAAAEVDADGQDGALVGGLRADAAHVLVDQVLELRALLLVAGGAQVGDVVGDHLNVEFLCRHSGRCSVKRFACYSDAPRDRRFRPERRRACRSAFLCRSLCCCSMLAISGVGAHHLDHAAHFDDRIDVGFLDEALAACVDLTSLRRAAAGRVEVVALLDQLLRIGEADEAQLAADRIGAAAAFLHRDGAVGGDRRCRGRSAGTRSGRRRRAPDCRRR